MDKKSVKKQEILKNSIGVMFEQGYHGTSVKDLTDAAGIPKGSLYHYFSNKEDYVKEAMKYYYLEMSKPQMLVLVDKELEPLDRIRQFFAKMIADLEEAGDLFKGCFVGNITQEVSGVVDSIQDVSDTIQREIINDIRNNLEEAQNKGQFNSQEDPEEYAEFIFNTWHGYLIRVKASRDKKTLDNFYNMLVKVLQ